MQNKWHADACPEEQKLHASIAKNQELQDLRLDATNVVPCGLVVTDYPHAIYCFNQFSHVKRALLCLIPCPSRWFVDCPSQILAKLGAAGRVDSWEEPSVRDASWQQWYAATVKFVIERNPWKSSGPRLLLWRGWLLMKLCCLCFFPPAHFGIRPYESYGEGAVDPDTSHTRIQAVCGSRVSFCTCGRVGAGTSDGWGNVCPGVPTQREILKRNCVKFWWILWISIVQFPCGSIFLSCDDSCCVLGRFVHCRGV